MEGVIIDEGREGVVGGGDGVEVAGKVEVNLFHRKNLGVTATGGASFHAEAGAEGRFPQGNDGLFSNSRHSQAQAN